MENRRRGILSIELHARLFVDALLSPAGKGLTSWLSFVMSNCYVVTFPQVWCLIVSIPDFCPLSYFYNLILDLVLKISTLMKFVRHSTSLYFMYSRSSILIL